MTQAIFRAGFQSFLLSAQNAQKVFEILDGAAVDLDYYNTEDAAKYDCSAGYALRPADRQNIHCEMITREDKEKQMDRYQARVRYEMRRELEEEEKLTLWAPDDTEAA